MDTLVPDDLWAAIAPLFPPEPLKPKGGRPPLEDRAALAGVILVQRTGMPWKHVPRLMLGCSGKTCWWRLWAWQEAAVQRRPHPGPLPVARASPAPHAGAAAHLLRQVLPRQVGA